MGSILIAEIGNNHFGDMDKAKELISLAVRSGASMVKMQAINPYLVKGSMPLEFYCQCALSDDQCVELMEFCENGFNVPLFFSIFGDRELKLFPKLFKRQSFFKVSAGQTKAYLEDLNTYSISGYDLPNVIMSIPEESIKFMNKMNHAKLMYATPYLVEDPKLNNIERIRFLSGSGVFGYSDHTIGIDWCVRAVRDCGSNIIEKHFTDEKNKEFGGIVFRDTVHGATPNEFEKLAKEIT